MNYDNNHNHNHNHNRHRLRGRRKRSFNTMMREYNSDGNEENDDQSHNHNQHRLRGRRKGSFNTMMREYNSNGDDDNADDPNADHSPILTSLHRGSNKKRKDDKQEASEPEREEREEETTKKRKKTKRSKKKGKHSKKRRKSGRKKKGKRSSKIRKLKRPEYVGTNGDVPLCLYEKPDDIEKGETPEAMLDTLYEKHYGIRLDPEQIGSLIICDCGAQLKRKRILRNFECNHEYHAQNGGGSTTKVWQCGSGCEYYLCSSCYNVEYK